ncbi:AAA family ATPase [Conexibacter sp. W3-3-2]|uniref:AAA family ATPase n=1 Tax=Conexibacter sp. W3-3-2 TaxID=2675227 RepID=UPI0018AAE762|nr:AAA family ATPase [Conexibacter sp. W3-3-2]
MSSTTVRPLRPTRADQALYVPRGIEQDLAEHLRLGRNLLITGAPGSGRTTLLAHLAHQDQDRRWTQITAEACRTPAALLLVALQALRGPLDSRELHDLSELSEQLVGPAVTARLLDEIADTLAAETAQRVLAVDGIRTQVGHSLFGSQRNDVWNLPLTWILTCTPGQTTHLLAPPADAFWDARATIPDLTDDQATQILARRDRPAPTPTRGPAPRTPRLLLAGAFGLPLPPTPTDPVAADDQHRVVLDWITAHGPVSASDPDLQNALGVRRGRLAQILAALRDSGDLTATRTPDPQTGRSRVLHAIADPQEPA